MEDVPRYFFLKGVLDPPSLCTMKTVFAQMHYLSDSRLPFKKVASTKFTLMTRWWDAESRMRML